MSAEHSVQDQEQGKYSVNLLIKVQILITVYVHVYEGDKKANIAASLACNEWQKGCGLRNWFLNTFLMPAAARRGF